MRKPTESERAAIMEYGANLSARMKELCISQERLAEAIGMSQKTVSRYLNGENQSLPPEKVQSRIEHFLKAQANFICEHMSPKQFAAVMRKTMDDYGISQAELAQQIQTHAPTRKKMDQRMLSLCINGTADLSSWDQYIIRCEMDNIHVRKNKERKYAMRYGEELNARLEELCIDRKEFAKKLSLPPDLVERWRRGEETAITFVQMEEIPRFLEERSVWQGYRHMPAAGFGRLLHKLLTELLHMMPEKFAELSGRTESSILRYLSGDAATSVREQWEILRYCYRAYRKMPDPLPFPTFNQWLESVLKREKGA